MSIRRVSIRYGSAVRDGSYRWVDIMVCTNGTRNRRTMFG